ncbi:hypothetical protein SMMN14_03191 [Sphaerulina musiva]
MNISISNCDTASTIKRHNDQSIDIMTFNQTCRYRVLMRDHPEGEGQDHGNSTSTSHLSQLYVQLHFPGDPPSRQPKVGIVIRIQLKMGWGHVHPSVAARRDKMPGYDQS